MAHKPKACTLAPKHKWEFVRNVTLKNVSMSARGTTMKISYRGKYRCACGELRLGISRPEPSQEVPCLVAPAPAITKGDAL